MERRNDQANPQPSTSTTPSRTNPNDVVREIKDQESRKPNLIIHNIPESDAEGLERVNHDKEKALEVANVCNVTWKNEDVVNAVRLGRKKMDGKPRPLLIKLVNEEKKKALFKNVKLLQTAPEGFKEIGIQNDLTKQQREEEKRLWEEAKRKETDSSGKEKYRVRGPPWARRVEKVMNQ